MTPSDLFTKYIPYNAYWEPCSAGFMVSRLESGSPPEEPFLLSNTTLRRIHPMLPYGLRLLVQEDSVQTATDIKRLLKTWECSMRFKTTDGVWAALHEVIELEFFEPSVRLRCSGYEYKTMEGPEVGSTVEISQGFVDSIFVGIEWLDESYPEWRTRYKLAQDLGLSETE